MNYFLLVYDQLKGIVTHREHFSGERMAVALERRFELEHQMRDRPEIEIVVLSADSEADLMRTHSRYFKSVSELAAAS